MTVPRRMDRQTLIAQMGLGSRGVKVGSIWMPLLLLIIATLAIAIYRLDSGRAALARTFNNLCTCARLESGAPPATLKLTDDNQASEQTSGKNAAIYCPEPPKPAAPQRSTSRRPLEITQQRQQPFLAEACRDPQNPQSVPQLREAFIGKPTLLPMADELAKFSFRERGGAKGTAEIGMLFAKAYFDELTATSAKLGWKIAEFIYWAALAALLPGLAGLVYRRSFWPWYAAGFAIAFAIQSWHYKPEEPRLQEVAFIMFFIASQTIVLLLSARLRRYTTRRISGLKPIYHNAALAAALLGIGYAEYEYDILQPAWPVVTELLLTHVRDWAELARSILKWDFILFGLPLIYTAFRRSELWTGSKPKNIVVCFDGTNNTPDQQELGRMAQTNVYKLFNMLKEDDPARRFPKDAFGASLTKAYSDKQIGFYYVGVGNQFENSPIGQLLGQAMGFGASGLVDRAYLDVLRVHQPGDKVYIFGFSRGAAIARLLARAVHQRTAPRSIWTLRLFGRHWTVWKAKPRSGQAGEIPIAVLGCWDTVGAFGLAKTIGGIDFQKIDLFKDLTVPETVDQAYHMVALDEERDAFKPTLMEPDPIKPGRIVEVWFSGDHANIGGGWATPKLSDITLDFLLRYVSSGYAYDPSMPPGAEEWGLFLIGRDISSLSPDDPARLEPGAVDPDYMGQLRKWTSALYEYTPRTLPPHAVISDTVFRRMTQSGPIYAPQSLFNLNEELDKKRMSVADAVERLRETNSLDSKEHTDILGYMDRLQLRRWKHHIKALEDAKAAPAPAQALKLERDDVPPPPLQ